MSTVISNDALQIEEPSSSHPAPKKILKHTYELVLSAIQSDKKIILITGDAKKGKTALIHTISKDLSSKFRIINLSGKDLPGLDDSSSTNNSELNLMKDFILESTDLEDRLVVTLDDADGLPVNFLAELVNHAKNSSPDSHNLQLVLSGPMVFKDQLLAIEQITDEDLTYYPMDSLSEEFIHKFAKDKTYKISSNIKRIVFKPEALHSLSEFIQNDKQLLDVVLEWCAAIVKKDQLSSITSHTVTRAAGFAQQFSKDKNLRLSNSYPPSHEVYKYINDIQSAKKSKQSSKNRIAKNATNKVSKKANKNKKSKPAPKPFIETKNNSSTQLESNIPTITSKVESNEIVMESSIDEAVNQYLHEVEEQIVPIQVTPPRSQVHTKNRKPFPKMVGLIGLLLLGFITLIAMRLDSDPVTNPNNDELANEQITLEKPKERLAEYQPEPVTDELKENLGKTAKPDETVQSESNVVPKQGVGIVASDIKNPAEPKTSIEKPLTTPEKKITQENKLSDKKPAAIARAHKNESALTKQPENKQELKTQPKTPPIKEHKME